jgi:hypothetical protein
LAHGRPTCWNPCGRHVGWSHRSSRPALALERRAAAVPVLLVRRPARTIGRVVDASQQRAGCSSVVFRPAAIVFPWKDRHTICPNVLDYVMRDTASAWKVANVLADGSVRRARCSGRIPGGCWRNAARRRWPKDCAPSRRRCSGRRVSRQVVGLAPTASPQGLVRRLDGGDRCGR